MIRCRHVAVLLLAGFALAGTLAGPAQAGTSTDGERLDALEREMKALKDLLRRQSMELERLRTSDVPAPAPTAPVVEVPVERAPEVQRIVRAELASPPPPPAPQPACWQRHFRAPCPPPRVDPDRDPCVCPEPLGDGDPSLVAGYDGKFYVGTRDGRFRLMFGMYTQFRWTWNRRLQPDAGSEQNSPDWEMSRARVHLEADFTKYFFTHFRINVNSKGDVEVINAYLRWTPRSDFTIRFGRQFIALSREDWMYPMDLMTVDFSANDSVFAIGTSNGMQARRTWDRDRWWLAVSDGHSGGGQAFGNTQQAEYAITTRYEHQFLTDDWSVWDDVVGRRGRPRGFLVGVAGGWESEGPDTDVIYGGLATADLSYNWDGGQAMVYGTWRWVDTRSEGSRQDWGFLAQAGHFVTCNLQIYGRYEMVAPGTREGDLDTYESALVGASYYPLQWSNLYKFSAEFGYLFDALSRTIVSEGSSIGFLDTLRGEQFYFRMQMQFGF